MWPEGVAVGQVLPPAPSIAPHVPATPAPPAPSRSAEPQTLAEWLASGRLRGRTRFERGGASILIDADQRHYFGPSALKPLAPLFESTGVDQSDFEPVGADVWSAQTAALGAAQPLARLVWYGALLAGGGRIVAGYDAGTRFRLTKWPQTEREFPKHFRIATAMNNLGHADVAMWDAEDGFFYDVLHLPDGRQHPVKIRSMVGLTPLFAVQTLEADQVDRLPGFKRRMDWFIRHRKDLVRHVACMKAPGVDERRLLAILDREQLRRVLAVMLDESEFLSPHGIRSVSRRHLEHPYVLEVNGTRHEVRYEPAESTTGLFGGNSNWRGPIWWPMNYLIIESLQKFHHYLGDEFRVECPTGSGRWLTLAEVAAELSRRLVRTFLRRPDGTRPVYGGTRKFQEDPHWRDLILFYEYFHGDNGAGIGASHQTGWTGLVAKLLQQSGE